MYNTTAEKLFQTEKSEFTATMGNLQFYLNTFRHELESGKDACLHIECHAGQVWLSFHLQVAHPPHQQQHRGHYGPSRVRRQPEELWHAQLQVLTLEKPWLMVLIQLRKPYTQTLLITMTTFLTLLLLKKPLINLNPILLSLTSWTSWSLSGPYTRCFRHILSCWFLWGSCRRCQTCCSHSTVTQHPSAWRYLPQRWRTKQSCQFCQAKHHQNSWHRRVDEEEQRRIEREKDLEKIEEMLQNHVNF